MTCRITNKYNANVSGYFQCDTCGYKQMYEYMGESLGNKIDVNKDKGEFIKNCVSVIKEKGWIIYKNQDTNEWNHKCPECANLEISIISNNE